VPYFGRESKRAKFWLNFRLYSDFELCDLKPEQIIKKIKTTLYSNDVWALICRKRRTSRASNSEKHLLKIVPKVRQLEKRLNRSKYASRELIEFKFHKVVLRGSRKDAELSKPT